MMLCKQFQNNISLMQNGSASCATHLYGASLYLADMATMAVACRNGLVIDMPYLVECNDPFRLSDELSR